MKHSVCFIDDKIPVAHYSEYFDDTDIVSSSVIKYLLKQEATIWEDVVVKNMCEKLLNEPGNWSVSAFTSPDFYNNYIKDTIYAPEIVIYDWDYNYGAGSDESEKHLQEILKSSYTMIFVFSGSDHIDEINEIVSKEEFKKFGDRLSVVDKNENNSIESVFSQIEQKERNNFSFAYGFEVVRNSNKAINQVLSDISLLSIEDFVASIGELKNGNSYVSSNEDFIDAIVPRYKSILRNYKVYNIIEKEKTGTPNIDNIRKVWSYRLYDRNFYNSVQMGDIVRDSENNYFLVLSSDCHLLRFWEKNIGFLSLIPLMAMDSDETKNRIKLKWKKSSLNNVKFSSLTNNAPISVLPCVPIDGEHFADFIIITKSIVTAEIRKGNDADKMLKYENLADYKKVTSISDPFKSPLIQHIFDNISGYGCPDFPDDLQNDLKKKVEGMLS
ncbi:MAG: hypothetical protein J5725_07390 [Bacteroidales bacterium]|nr:hypothetical protein [Bacteroidales bacterium]